MICLCIQIHKTGDFLKAIFFYYNCEDKRRESEKGDTKKKEKNLKGMGGKQMTLFSAWPHRQLIQVCSLLDRLMSDVCSTFSGVTGELLL